MKALVISNCATATYVDALKVLFPQWDVRGAVIDMAIKWLGDEPRPAVQEFHDTADLLLTIQPSLRPAPAGALVIPIPGFFFRGLHPDSFYLEGGPPSVLKGGQLYSRIATVAFMLGRTAAQTEGLFCPEVFEAIGYLDAYDGEQRRSIDLFAANGIDIAGPFERWRASGNFLYTLNHPKVFVFTDILVQALTGTLIAAEEAVSAAEGLGGLTDWLERSIVWPVYPEIGRRHGIDEPFVWRTGEASGFEEIPLGVFVTRTFQQLAAHPNLNLDLIPGADVAAKAIG